VQDTDVQKIRIKTYEAPIQWDGLSRIRVCDDVISRHNKDCY